MNATLLGAAAGVLALLVTLGNLLRALLLRGPEAAKLRAEAGGEDAEASARIVTMAAELARLQQEQINRLLAALDTQRQDCARETTSLRVQISTLREAWEEAVQLHPELRNTHAVESPARTAAP